MSEISLRVEPAMSGYKSSHQKRVILKAEIAKSQG